MNDFKGVIASVSGAPNKGLELDRNSVQVFTDEDEYNKAYEKVFGSSKTVAHWAYNDDGEWVQLV